MTVELSLTYASSKTEAFVDKFEHYNINLN